MTNRETMRLALEALEQWMRIDTVEDMHIFETVIAPEAIAVLRTALEQEPWDTTDMAYRPSGLSMGQEPVAWVRDLTSAQPNCVTDLRYMSVADTEAGVQYIPLYAAPPKQPEQEPVACKHNRYSVDVHEQTGTCYDCGAEGRMRFVVDDTAPPKREWVGLTDEEIQKVAYDMGTIGDLSHDEFDVCRAVIAKLKEKNRG